MSFSDALQTRLNVLRRKGADIPELIVKHQREAVIAAVEVATEMTPPNEDSGARGANTITGEAKQHWAVDSQTEPEIVGNIYKVTLANNKEYISYLNNGHRMDEHFVPGLIVNPNSGMLEKVDPSIGGIIVGTKTQYVPGIFMREAAIEKYQEVLLQGMETELEKIYNG